MDKRKDSKGRVLKTGESERSDGRYQFRYSDAMGNRQTIYAATLNELRKKEEEIQRAEDKGLDYRSGLMSVKDYYERFMQLKHGVRLSTQRGYKVVLNVLEEEHFGMRAIGSVKVSDAKLWFIEMHQKGRGIGSLTVMKSKLASAFEMAVEDDIIAKNPFRFKLGDIIDDRVGHREALTPIQQLLWLNFIRRNPHHREVLDEIIIMLGTGMRVSELCGLTYNDLDFMNSTIRIDHQLLKRPDGSHYISQPKSKTGIRTIPMSQTVRMSLLSVLNRPYSIKTETNIDGYEGFLFYNQRGRVMDSILIDKRMLKIMKEYRKAYPNDDIPNVTPHVLRHTFCTNMANAGMDVKSLQYIMGHSDVTLTLNIYTDGSFEQAEQQFQKIDADRFLTAGAF